MDDCHICGRAVVPPDQTVRYPSCECHLDLARLSSENAALKSKLGDTRSGSQGVVTEEMVERACLAYVKESDRDFRHEVPGYTWMRAALLAAMGGRGDGWISVKERMPETGIRVMLNCSGCREKEQIGAYEGRQFDRPWNLQWVTLRNEEVTHWRPLPPPPATISEERA